MEQYSESSSSPPPSSTEARTNRDSIKKGFNDFRKFADTNFTRAKQYVTEKAGKADTVTEYEEEYEILCHKMEQIKIVTEKVLAHVESVLQPNPNIRLEDWALTKLDRPRPPRLNPYYTLSADLSIASEAFGQDTEHGAYLMYCSQVEMKISESQKRFQEKVALEVLTPLKAFLEVDIKSAIRERKTLNMDRLDLDARRASHKKSQGTKVTVTEMALRDAQAEYDQQLEKVQMSLRKIIETHMKNKGYLHSFMEAQRAFHTECQGYFVENTGGNLYPLPAVNNIEGANFSVGGLELDRGESRQARMLYDYEAVNRDEISIDSGKILKVTSIPNDSEYLMAECDGEVGKIPSTYLDFNV